MRSIRARITAWGFAVFALLVVSQTALVLGALDRGLLRLADADLREQLERLASEAGDARLAELLAREDGPGQSWGDLIFELRDELERNANTSSGGNPLIYEIRRSDGPPVAASPVLAEHTLDSDGAPTSRSQVHYYDAADPSRPGDRLRVAEVALGPYRLRVARSVAPLLRIQSAVRQDLLGILVGMGAIGMAGAFLIATRALSPLRRLATEAERLRTLSEGALPRTGRGDEIDDLARLLNDLLDRVRGDVQRMRQFTADAAHEIRTPLAAIRGHLELLMGRVDAEADASLETVLEEVDRLARLVSQLLLLEKLEGGTPTAELMHRELDLGRLAAELAEHLSVLASEQGIALRCEVDPAPVRGDPEKLRQVFLNLFDNAFKYTPCGGEVQLRVLRDGACVRAVVEDSGPGIAPDRLESIFDRFSSDRSHATAGTGLGLPIARAIAEAHGGTLRASSPNGAAFTLELPAVASNEIGG